MKAIVLEYKNGEAAILREDGVVTKIRRECSVGEEIILPDENKKIVRFGAGTRRLAVAAAAVVVILGGTYHYTTVQAASYVTVEGEASVEYVLNRRGQVIAVNGLDEAGQDVQKKFEENGKRRCTLAEAMEYIETSGTDTTYSVVAKNEQARESIKSEVETWVEQKEIAEPTVAPEVYEGTMEDKEAAQRHGESTGQYLKEKQEEQHEQKQEEPVQSIQEEQEPNDNGQREQTQQEYEQSKEGLNLQDGQQEQRIPGQTKEQDMNR